MSRSNLKLVSRTTRNSIEETARIQKQNERRERIFNVLVHPLVGLVVAIVGVLLAESGAKSIGTALGLHDMALAGPGAWVSIGIGFVLVLVALFRFITPDHAKETTWHLLGGH